MSYRGHRTKGDILSGVTDEMVSSKKIANNTVEYFTASGDRVIRLHDTNIIRYKKNGRIVLNSGGWRTSTTRDRINSFLKSTDDSHIGVYRAGGVWFLSITVPGDVVVHNEWGDYTPPKTVQNVPFIDGMELYHNRVMKKWVTKSDRELMEELRTQKRLDRYMVHVKKLLTTKGVPAPSGGHQGETGGLR